MKNNNYLFLFVIITGFLISIGNPAASAADMNYSVKAVIPENQIDQSKTYFDLKMAAGEQQEISLEIENSSEQDVTIQVDMNTATTNRNGVINYGESKGSKDSSLTYDISKLITGENEVVLLPKEKRTVNYMLTMPKKSFDGILLGGFYIHKKMTQEEIESEKNVQIKNDFSYIVGVKLTETDKKIEPDLELNTITPGLQNYQTVVNATLQNTSPIIISGMTVDAKVSKEGSDKILHETKKDNQSMAPNSSYEFPISWDNQELKPGKYNLRVKAIDGNNHEWQFSREFEIKSDAKKFNKEAIKLEKNYNFQRKINVAVILLILIGIIYLFFKKTNRL